ncbi:hypothetical protein ACKLNQ_03335 [Myroides odoratimimus]|uniref:hypothetical protein n=1 Tax=Myroides odoratimimus TaxID=76832 RepID=UPI0038D3AA34
MGTEIPKKGKLTISQQKFIKVIKQYDLFKALETLNWERNEFESMLENDNIFRRTYYEAIGLNTKQADFLKIYPKKLFNISKTCRTVGLNRKTFYRWKKSNPEFLSQINDLREGLYDDVESIIFHKIFVEHDTTVLIFFAKTQMKDRGYSEKIDVKASVQPSQNCNCRKYKDLSDEELHNRIKQLEKIARLEK